MANCHILHVVPHSSVATTYGICSFYVTDTRNMQCKVPALSLAEGSGLSSDRPFLPDSGFSAWIHAKLEYRLLYHRLLRDRHAGLAVAYPDVDEAFVRVPSLRRSGQSKTRAACRAGTP